MRTGDSKAEVSGDVELVLQWRYNARLDFCPFDDFVDEHVGEAPNELRIALIRAQGLAIADKNLLSKGGSPELCANQTSRHAVELHAIDATPAQSRDSPVVCTQVPTPAVHSN